jgi:hypothetical protein
MRAVDCFDCCPSVLWTWIPLLVTTLAMTGCGTGGSPATIPGQAPTIATEPASATIPLGSAATLTVAATGTGPLNYQWTENGNLVPGATSTSLTTAALQLADSGDQFTVTVSNAYGSVTSAVANITIGPRSPAQRDMRFKHVQLSPNLVGNYSTNVGADIPGNMLLTNFTGEFGSPLEVGNQSCGTILSMTSCGWRVAEFGGPTSIPGFNSAYGVDLLTNLNNDLAELGSNAVVTSLDEQNGPGFAYGVVAYSVETDPTVSGGFTIEHAQVTDADLATTVSAMAAKGVVVTAVSVNSAGAIDLVAYGWTGDAGTVYDAQTMLTTYLDAASQAESLAQQGYIITAVGTADANQVLLVGTKVHGDTLPRNLSYTNQQGNGGTVSDGQIIVGNVFGNDAGNNPNLPGYSTVLAQ